MVRRFGFRALLLTAITVSAAADPVRLGLDYATHLQSVVPGPLISPAIATDAAGALYILNNDIGSVAGVLAKLNATGTGFVYRMPLPESLEVAALAIDREGYAYITRRIAGGSLPVTQGVPDVLGSLRLCHISRGQ